MQSSITFVLAPQRQSVQWIISLIAAAARDGLRVTACARILFAAIGALVQVPDGTALAAHMFSLDAFFVQQMAQFFQTIASNGSLVSSDSIITVMAMAARRSTHTVCQVNQLVRHCNLDRLRLHIRLNKDQVPVAAFMQFLLSIIETWKRLQCRRLLAQTSTCCRRRWKITIA